MKQNMTTEMLCAVLASGAMVLLAPPSAEASEVLNRLRSHGLGKWVDKYVEEDKSGKMLYKPASQDNFSANYYDSKTGKWTGKKDGVGLEKTPSAAAAKKVSSKPVKKDTVSLSSGKASTTTRMAANTTSKRKKWPRSTDVAANHHTATPYSAVASNAVAEKAEAKAPDTQIEPAVNPNVQNSAASEPVSVATPEMYGPPSPEQGIASTVN